MVHVNHVLMARADHLVSMEPEDRPESTAHANHVSMAPRVRPDRPLSYVMPCTLLLCQPTMLLLLERIRLYYFHEMDPVVFRALRAQALLHFNWDLLETTRFPGKRALTKRVNSNYLPTLV